MKGIKPMYDFSSLFSITPETEELDSEPYYRSYNEVSIKDSPLHKRLLEISCGLFLTNSLTTRNIPELVSISYSSDPKDLFIAVTYIVTNYSISDKVVTVVLDSRLNVRKIYVD